MNRLVLGVCFCLLLSASAVPAAGGPVEADVLAKTSKSWDGSPLPEYPKGTPEVSILRIRIAPGARLPMHKHPVINTELPTRGRQLTVITDDNAILQLKAGDTIVEVVDTWHYAKNEGNEPAEIVVFYFGRPGSQLSVSKQESPSGR
jgi:quercetin dioxygenase-like cupin family protein